MACFVSSHRLANRRASSRRRAALCVVALCLAACEDPGEFDGDASFGFDGSFAVPSCPVSFLCGRDPFVAPFPLASFPGWRDGFSEQCTGTAGRPTSTKIATTPVGVATFVSTHREADQFATSPGWTVSHNFGTGWFSFASAVLEPFGTDFESDLASAPTGELFVTMVEDPFDDVFGLCAVARVNESGVVKCYVHPFGSDVVAITFPPSGPALALSTSDVRTVGPDEFAPLFAWPAVDLFLPTDLWTDGTTTVVVGSNGVVLRHTPADGVVTLPGAPSREFVRITGSSATNLFLGTSAGTIVHFDGADFEETPLPTRMCGDRDRIVDLFLDADGTLFYATRHTYGEMAPATSPVDLAHWGCTSPFSFTSLAGSSTSQERYLGFENADHMFQVCGAAHFVVHSGTGFRFF